MIGSNTVKIFTYMHVHIYIYIYKMHLLYWEGIALINSPAFILLALGNVRLSDVRRYLTGFSSHVNFNLFSCQENTVPNVGGNTVSGGCSRIAFLLDFSIGRSEEEAHMTQKCTDSEIQHSAYVYTQLNCQLVFQRCIGAHLFTQGIQRFCTFSSVLLSLP